MSSAADRRPRRALLLPLGSSGDVNPFLWIGRLLHAQGCDVTVAANPVFAPSVEALGLRHLAFGTEAEFREILGHPDIWHPRKGPPILLAYAGKISGQHYDLIARELASQPAGEPLPLVLAPATAFGARLAREKFGLPLVTVQLQPCMFLTAGDTALFLRGLAWLRAAPTWMKRIAFSIIRLSVGSAIAPGVRRACRAAGVPPPGNPYRDWMQSPDGGLCLWPEWFGPPQPEWGPRVHCAGFPLYDLADQLALPPELEAFLAAGSPPVLFTPGTAMAHGEKFFEVARDACLAAGRRGIFASKFPETLPALPPEIFPVPYAPFSALLPRCAAIVHHGGVGTTSQALAAGIPQIIRPFSHDQPDHAARIRRLGVGECLWPKDFTRANVTRVLSALLGDPARHDRCAEIAARVRAEPAARRLLEILKPHLEADAR